MTNNSHINATIEHIAFLMKSFVDSRCGEDKLKEISKVTGYKYSFFAPRKKRLMASELSLLYSALAFNIAGEWIENYYDEESNYFSLHWDSDKVNGKFTALFLAWAFIGYEYRAGRSCEHQDFIEKIYHYAAQFITDKRHFFKRLVVNRFLSAVSAHQNNIKIESTLLYLSGSIGKSIEEISMLLSHVKLIEHED